MIIYLIKSSRDADDIKRKLLAYILKEQYNINFKNICIAYGKYGKPYFLENPNIKFNISHCNGLWACAIGKVEVGIDIEKIRGYDPYVAYRVCSLEEEEYINNSKNRNLAFFKLWTLKESLGKFLGVGLNYDKKKASFSINNNKISCINNGYNFYNYQVFDEYLLSICINNTTENIELKEVYITDERFHII